MVLLSGDAGVGKTRLLTEALDRLAEQGWHRARRTLSRLRRDLDALPAVRRDARPGGRGRPGLGGRSGPRASRAVPAAPPGARRRALRGARPRRGLRGGLLAGRAARRPTGPVVHGGRGRPLGRREHPRPDQLPAVPAAAGPLPAGGDLPLRRDAPAAPTAPARRGVGAASRSRTHPARSAPGRGRPRHGRAADQQPGEALGARYDEDIARIVQRSQGNAFYVEELVGAFLGGGWSLPEDLADLLLVRLDRLDESARDVVRVASAAGQRVSHDLLAAVAPVDRGRARGRAARGDRRQRARADR